MNVLLGMVIDVVFDVVVDRKGGTAKITYDPTKTTPAAVAKAITEKAGFTSVVKD